MRLYLLAEERTREDVIEPIVECIRKNIPQLNDISIERYNLPCERILRYEFEHLDSTRMRQLTKDWEPLQPVKHLNSSVILKSDIDVLELFSRKQNGCWRLYSTSRIFENSRQNLPTLITIGHYSFDVERSPDSLSIDLRRGGGRWFDNYDLGVATIKNRPTYRHSFMALHELGHYLGLGHHSDCVMTAGRPPTQNLPKQFCEDCKKVIQQHPK